MTLTNLALFGLLLFVAGAGTAQIARITGWPRALLEVGTLLLLIAVILAGTYALLLSP